MSDGELTGDGLKVLDTLLKRISTLEGKTLEHMQEIERLHKREEKIMEVMERIADKLKTHCHRNHMEAPLTR